MLVTDLAVAYQQWRVFQFIAEKHNIVDYNYAMIIMISFMVLCSFEGTALFWGY